MATFVILYGHSYSLDRGHEVMIDDPDALAALLLEELGPHG